MAPIFTIINKNSEEFSNFQRKKKERTPKLMTERLKNLKMDNSSNFLGKKKKNIPKRIENTEEFEDRDR